jgi:hypothetical protein
MIQFQSSLASAACAAGTGRTAARSRSLLLEREQRLERGDEDLGGHQTTSAGSARRRARRRLEDRLRERARPRRGALDVRVRARGGVVAAVREKPAWRPFSTIRPYQPSAVRVCCAM